MVAKAMTNTILTLLSAELIERHYASGHWRDDTIYSLVRDHARRAPEKFALRERFRRLGYGELAATVDVLAADLAARGVKPGERVAVWLPSRMEGVIALLTCSRNGYACCPSLHRDHTSAEIVELLRRTRAAAFIGQAGYGADADRRDIFAELGGIETLKHVYRLEPPGISTPSWPGLSRNAGHDEGNIKRDPNKIVYLAFTSGTAGSPKGVMHSDNTLLANARAMVEDWHHDERTILLSLRPLSHHIAAVAVAQSLAAGMELAVNAPPSGMTPLDWILETGASYVMGVPTHAMDILGEMRRRGLDS